jgi:hypothetical protein
MYKFSKIQNFWCLLYCFGTRFGGVTPRFHTHHYFFASLFTSHHTSHHITSLLTLLLTLTKPRLDICESLRPQTQKTKLNFSRASGMPWAMAKPSPSALARGCRSFKTNSENELQKKLLLKLKLFFLPGKSKNQPILENYTTFCILCYFTCWSGFLKYIKMIRLKIHKRRKTIDNQKGGPTFIILYNPKVAQLSSFFITPMQTKFEIP